jgi:hypothetical protein
VNCKAYPVLKVKRRKYRLRFLGASIARIYDLMLMRSNEGPVAARSLGYKREELQGQYRLRDARQCMRLMQIASEGGLLPNPIPRDSFELWPANRREFVVDFTHYMDGTDTRPGDVIYLVNTMKMTDGRLWDSNDPAYKVPILKIVIGDDADDQSVMPQPTDVLRPAPARRMTEAQIGAAVASAEDRGREFTLQRGSVAGQPETEWLINDMPFDALAPLATVRTGDSDVWVIRNGGGGWVHPMHLHQEEHQVVMRNGTTAPDSRHPDDTGKMDVVSLDPSEEVAIYRSFRTFTGPYVGHCHNLAHEDHNMMFGWDLIPAGAPIPDPGGDPDPGGGHDDHGTPSPGGTPGAGGATGAGGAAAAGGGAGAGATTEPGDSAPDKRRKKTVATLSCKLVRSNGRRVARLRVSDSRGRRRQRVTVRIRRGGHDIAVSHPLLRNGRGTLDVPLSRSLKGRYEVLLVLDDGTKVRKTIVIR